MVSLRARDEGVQLPALQLLLYPVTNFGGETRSQTLFADGLLPDQARHGLVHAASTWTVPIVDAADPRVSPLLADDLSGLPPALVLTGGLRPAARRGQPVRRGACAAAGVTVDHREFGSLVHGFANFFPLGGGSATATADIDLGAAGASEPRLRSRGTPPVLLNPWPRNPRRPPATT